LIALEFVLANAALAMGAPATITEDEHGKA
jgi:hypothetical protein